MQRDGFFRVIHVVGQGYGIMTPAAWAEVPQSQRHRVQVVAVADNERAARGLFKYLPQEWAERPQAERRPGRNQTAPTETRRLLKGKHRTTQEDCTVKTEGTQTYDEEDVRRAWFARQVDLDAEAVQGEAQTRREAVEGVLWEMARIAQPGAERDAHLAELLRAYDSGKRILKHAHLQVGRSFQAYETRPDPLRSEDAPVLLTLSGYVATTPLMREVTLRKDDPPQRRQNNASC